MAAADGLMVGTQGMLPGPQRAWQGDDALLVQDAVPAWTLVLCTHCRNFCELARAGQRVAIGGHPEDTMGLWEDAAWLVGDSLAPARPWLVPLSV